MPQPTSLLKLPKINISNTTNISIATAAATAAIILTAGGTLYLRKKHARLARRISHRHVSVEERRSQAGSQSSSKGDSGSSSDEYRIESLPDELISHPEDFHLIHDRDSIEFTYTPYSSRYHSERDSDGQGDGISSSTLTSTDANPEELITQLLRRNMLYFSRWTLQGWSLYLLSRRFPQDILPTQSFTSGYISRLEFDKGDVVCGVYQVLSRSHFRLHSQSQAQSQPRSNSEEVEAEGEVKGNDHHSAPSVVTIEMGMRHPPGMMEGLDGRLIVRLHLDVNPSSGDEGEKGETKSARLTTETLQWTRRRETGQLVLPLDRSALRWLHELACWSLLVSGARFVRERLEGANVSS